MWNEAQSLSSRAEGHTLRSNRSVCVFTVGLERPAGRSQDWNSLWPGVFIAAPARPRPYLGICGREPCLRAQGTESGGGAELVWPVRGGRGACAERGLPGRIVLGLRTPRGRGCSHGSHSWERSGSGGGLREGKLRVSSTQEGKVLHLEAHGGRDFRGGTPGRVGAPGDTHIP